MLFVNNIGEVVHQVCDRFQGSANKNIGDAFLLVWKLGDGKYTINKDNTVVYHDERHVQMYSDCALITFMKFWAKMNREPIILKYREDYRL
jgi:class 3 adenylate cyclase